MRAEDELQMLRNEADAVKSDLEGINKRIEELESRSSQP
jgi:prefoldin subunit 5